jgi:hypothetical protein
VTLLSPPDALTVAAQARMLGYGANENRSHRQTVIPSQRSHQLAGNGSFAMINFPVLAAAPRLITATLGTSIEGYVETCCHFHGRERS